MRRPDEHRVCVVSPDWLAADRVGIALMGIELAKVELLGEPLARHVRSYRLHDQVEKQLVWQLPPREG